LRAVANAAYRILVDAAPCDVDPVGDDRTQIV
jgi:hypothetical protein